MTPMAHKVQTVSRIPRKHLCFPHAGFKAGLGEGFNPQHLLRDGQCLRKLDSAGHGELVGARSNVWGTLGQYGVENVISTPHTMPPSFAVSALHSGADREA